MTKAQAEILERIAQLPDAERRALVAHLAASNMGGESFYDRMTPEQRAALAEGIGQAERGEVITAEEVFERIARRLGFSAK